MTQHQDDVAQILTAGHHLLDLIDEVLDFTSVDVGRLTLSLAPVDVSEVIGEALELMGPIAAQAGITLPSEGPPDSRLVTADRQRLLQVLLNLISNAVKYNVSGGSITIGCESGEDTTLVTITDTGQGIAPEKMPELFKPFQRLGAEASGVQGTGLGLALSRSLVEAMGGHLRAASEPGVGSTFWFRLPAVTERPAEGKPALAPQAPVSLPIQPADILYIEDNLSNLKLLQTLFRDRPQFRLMSAMQGGLGLELARAGHPKVILLDLHLPDMGGEEVLAELRKGSQTKGIPVIVISADANAQTAERVLAAGASAFIPKPLDLRRFLTALSEALA